MFIQIGVFFSVATGLVSTVTSSIKNLPVCVIITIISYTLDYYY